MKKYRVNESEHFNLYSMYEHLKALECIYQEDEPIPMNIDEVYSKLAKVESLMDKVYCVGALVDWPTLKAIREIQAERREIRYASCLKAGAKEADAALAFEI